MTNTLEAARREGALEARKRAAAIMRSAAAEGRLAQAKALALDTEMSAEEAIKVLAGRPLDQGAAALQLTDQQIEAAMAKSRERLNAMVPKPEDTGH